MTGVERRSPLRVKQGTEKALKKLAFEVILTEVDERMSQAEEGNVGKS